MFVEQTFWSSATGWIVRRAPRQVAPAQVVLFFGPREAVEASQAVEVLRAAHPKARILGCTTAGEISETKVFDESVVATAIHFEHTMVRAACQPLRSAENSRAAGERIARELTSDDLAHVFVLAEGLNVNGSELVAGLREGLPASVAVTGGLAADGARFENTCVYFDGECESGAVAAVGFYGNRVRIGYGSMGGWDTFGPERLVTRSEGNVLYELDGSSALELYKKYLGAHAAELPASGLLFPLSLRGESGDQRIVRTILGIDEGAGSLVFAGDISQGSYARLMKANVDRLIDGASGAATSSYAPIAGSRPSLAILISCVGRKLPP